LFKLNESSILGEGESNTVAALMKTGNLDSEKLLNKIAFTEFEDLSQSGIQELYQYYKYQIVRERCQNLPKVPMQLLENVKPESHHRLWSPKKIQGILDVVADFGTKSPKSEKKRFDL